MDMMDTGGDDDEARQACIRAIRRGDIDHEGAFSTALSHSLRELLRGERASERAFEQACARATGVGRRGARGGSLLSPKGPRSLVG